MCAVNMYVYTHMYLYVDRFRLDLYNDDSLDDAFKELKGKTRQVHSRKQPALHVQNGNAWKLLAINEI